MTPLSRFRHWIADSLLLEAQARHLAEIAERQQEAYRLGHETGFLRGQAFGQLEGQQILLAELVRYSEERRAELVEVTASDLERARKGILH